MMRAGVAVATTVAAAIVAMSTAPASHLRIPDSRDTNGALDVRAVAVLGDRTVTWKVVTWTRWSTRSIRDRGFVLVYLDTFGDSRADYYALVRSTGARLEGSLWRDREARPDVRLGWLRVRRPGPASLEVVVSLSRLNMSPDRVEYGWRVQTLLSGARCPRVCFDHAPNAGMIAEPNPHAAPSPTPSNTLLPTPTATSTPTPAP